MHHLVVGATQAFEFHDLHVSEWVAASDAVAESSRPKLEPLAPLTNLLSSFFKQGSKVNLTAAVDTNIPPTSNEADIDPVARRLLAQTKASVAEHLEFLKPLTPEAASLVHALRSVEVTLPQDQPAHPEKVSKHGLMIEIQFIGQASNPFLEFLPALLAESG
jgi:hypothetical protein